MVALLSDLAVGLQCGLRQLPVFLKELLSELVSAAFEPDDLVVQLQLANHALLLDALGVVAE